MTKEFLNYVMRFVTSVTTCFAFVSRGIPLQLKHLPRRVYDAQAAFGLGDPLDNSKAFSYSADIINVLLKYDIPLGDALIRAIDAEYDDAIKAICKYLHSREVSSPQTPAPGTALRSSYHISPLSVSRKKASEHTKCHYLQPVSSSAETESGPCPIRYGRLSKHNLTDFKVYMHRDMQNT